MTQTRLLAAAAAVALVTCAPALAAQKRIYLAPDDHTDMIWSAPESYYYPYFSNSLDWYLDRIDETAAAPSDQQMRWNTDGTLWLWAYAQRHTQPQVDRLIGRIRDGHIGVPMNTIVSVHGATPLEGVLRDYYAAGRLERQYGLRFELGIAQENQVSSYGLGALLSGSGARYFHKGVCACASDVQAAGDRQFGAYWWGGQDGSRILSKWMSLEPQLPGAVDRNQGPGGYAETFLPRQVVPLVSGDPGFAARWPYDVIGLIGEGWDNVDWFKTNDDPVWGIPAVARDLTDGSRRVIASNMTDFFRDFEASYGASLPTQSVSFGNDWEVCTAAFAAKSGRVKRALEGLRGAEAMATLVALNRPGFLDGRAEARDTAFRSVGLYFEHNVCGGGNSGAGGREAYQEAKAQAIEGYISGLTADARAALGGLIAGAPGTRRVFAFNPLGWVRTDVATAAAPGTGPVRVVDVASGTEVAAETVGTGPSRTVRFLAAGVPSLGYRLFEVQDAAPASFPVAGSYSAGTLTSARYQLVLGARGQITGLVERANGRQLVVARSAINDFGSGNGTVSLERAGPVSITARVDVPGTLPRTVRVTLYAGLDRIDIEDRIGARFNTTKAYAFNFNVPTPVIRHEELGAVLRAAVQPVGDYTARPQNANFEWLTLNHFIAVTAGVGGPGVVLSNADAYFMKLNSSTQTFLDARKAKIAVLAGRPIPDIQNQAGDRDFLYRFAVRPVAAYTQADAMRTALEHGNALVTGEATGGPAAPLAGASYSLLSLSDPDQFVWSVKPAEEGIGAGVIVRVWNQGATATAFAPALAPDLRLGGVTRTTHIETDLPGGDAAVAGRGIATFRLAVGR